jgi:hypothetical protein
MSIMQTQESTLTEQQRTELIETLRSGTDFDRVQCPFSARLDFSKGDSMAPAYYDLPGWKQFEERETVGMFCGIAARIDTATGILTCRVCKKSTDVADILRQTGVIA